MVSILPVLVFVAETCVITLATVRTIFIARGMKARAAFLGFFEVSIWLFAIGQVMQNLTSVDCYLAFASGFSLGNYLGVLIETKLALGNAVVQITTRKDANEVTESLRFAGYGVTTLEAQGATGPVQVIFTVIKRRELGNVLTIIKRFDANIFYSVNDLQSAAAGVHSPAKRWARRLVPLAFQRVEQDEAAAGSSGIPPVLPFPQEAATGKSSQRFRRTAAKSL